MELAQSGSLKMGRMTIGVIGAGSSILRGTAREISRGREERGIEQEVRYANITIIEGNLLASSESVWFRLALRRSCCATNEG
jgi:hypothetical protein